MYCSLDLGYNVSWFRPLVKKVCRRVSVSEIGSPHKRVGGMVTLGRETKRERSFMGQRPAIALAYLSICPRSSPTLPLATTLQLLWSYQPCASLFPV